jgi:SAM-dependent methyltransferase
MAARKWLRISTLKSWDVALFADLLIRELPTHARVVDVGSVASELLWALHLAGFEDLVGCDVDARVVTMPFAGRIHYRIGELSTLHLPAGSVDAVTAVSTIEHGVDLRSFLATTSSLLRPGGLLCLSTDYWPDKLDTQGLNAFGLPWTIFDRREIHAMIDLARKFGLRVNEDGGIPSVSTPPIFWNGRNYTFLAIVFVKVAAA